jgi:hypothetical protein
MTMPFFRRLPSVRRLDKKPVQSKANRRFKRRRRRGFAATRRLKAALNANLQYNYFSALYEMEVPMIAIFPEIAAAAAAGDVERLAVLVRKYFAGPAVHAPQLDVASLLLGAGVEVQRLPLGGGTLAALLAKDERGAFNIVAVLGTGKISEPSQRFLLAHMLGHFLFDIQPLIARGDLQVSGYRESACPLKRYGQGGLEAEVGGQEMRRKEERADDFAAAVLLPKGMTRKAFASFKSDVERTARFFGVTRACLVRRLTQIDVLDAPPASFLDAEQSLGGAAPGAPADYDREPLQMAAPEGTSMPRAYAASSYGKAARETGRGKGKEQVQEKEQASTAKVKGMERLRELARKLDPEVKAK